jgi:uncharacterized membrane protein HdeD (DUF308 family)
VSIGLGIALIVIGLIVIFALNFDLPFLNDTSLGAILIVAGAVTLILSLVIHAQRSRSRTVSETRVQGQPVETQEVRREDPPPAI